MDGLNLESLNSLQKRELLQLLEEQERRRNRRKFYDLYPATGPLRRELYPKHMEYFRRGAVDSERGMIAANRVGKTWGVGAYETTIHATGIYPDWWEGKRFSEPTSIWVAGDTSQTTRDVIQFALFGVGGEGADGELGSGMIPGDLIVGTPSAARGVSGAFDTGMVRHVTGGLSSIGHKSYDQGRKKFQGTAKHVVWLDEEPPLDVYTECLTRIMTVKGILMSTFTPLEGATAVVNMYLEAQRA
jgi:phage terminase large subunit-like protein